MSSAVTCSAVKEFAAILERRAVDRFALEQRAHRYRRPDRRIYGALLWMAGKLQSDQGEHALSLWAAKRKQAFGDN